MPIIQEIANRIAKYFWERHKAKKRVKREHMVCATCLVNNGHVHQHTPPP